MQIDADALGHNLRSLKALAAPQSQIAAVVKGNAYGHGMAEVVSILDGMVDLFQLDDLEELRQFRQVSDARVMVLGHIVPEDLEEAAQLGAEIALFDPWQIEPLRRLPEKVRVHIEVDVLLGRLGVLPDRLNELLVQVRECPSLEVVALYGHYANIEDTTDLAHACAQGEAFEECWQELRREGFADVGRHLSATSGLMTIEKSRPNDIVRLGIGLYGMYPSTSLERTHSDLKLSPVLRWVSRLSQVKTIPAGHSVGYGLTYIAPREMRIGIVPQGYSDGYDRGLSNSGEVLVQGQRCPVIGRIAMNMFAIDLSDVPGAQANEEVVLLGEQGDARITAEEIAARIGTINYEITTRVSSLLPRRIAAG